MREKKYFYFFMIIGIFFFTKYSISQSKYDISGFVKDKDGKPLGNIYVLASTIVPPGMGMPTILYKSITDATGFYKLEGLESGRGYQINAQKEGLSFDPLSKIYESLNENKKLDFIALFSSTVNTKVSITGIIKDKSGNPVKDVELLLSGLREYRTLTDQTGNYKFENSEAGSSFKLIPSKPGLVFDPRYKVFEYNSVQNITQDFIAIPQSALTYSITGYILIKSANALPSDIIVNLSGGKTDKIIADKSGFFVFNNLEGGKNYTITPLRAGLKFDPEKIDLINLIEDKKLAFNALINSYTKYAITGSILDKDSKPITGVKVIVRSNSELVTSTDDKGFYKFERLDSAYTYSVQPSKEGYIFQPRDMLILSLLENRIINFVGTPIPTTKLTISGYCKDKESKAIQEVELTLGSIISSIPPLKAKSDLNGLYKFENISAGMPYFLTAQKAGFQFDPKSKSFDLLMANATQDFIGLPIIQSKFTIEGFIFDRNQLPITKAAIEIIGGIASKVFSDEKGYFKFDQLDGNLKYSITVNMEGFVFEPKMMFIENLNQNMILKFIGIKNSLVPKYIIKGTVTDNNSKPLPNIQIQLGGEKFESILTDVSGNYKFINLDSGRFYSVMALSMDYTFNPRGKSFENLNQEKVQNFTATPVSNTKYSISGFAKDKGNKPISEVIMVLGGEMNAKVITGNDGFYKFDGLIGGRFYTIIPNKRGFVFEPRGKGFEPLNENKEQNFTCTQTLSNSYSISGFISDGNLGFMSGITLRLSGDIQTVIMTDENGFFCFDNLEEGKQYIITPSKTGLTFSPASILVNGYQEAGATNINSSLDIKLTETKKPDIIPDEIYLYQNYPNPFNPSTMIRYTIPKESDVILKVFDVLGREVKILVNERQTPNSYQVRFDGENIPGGIYYYHLKTENYIEMKKMILLK